MNLNLLIMCSKRVLLLLVLVSSLFNMVRAEKCWRSEKLGEGGPDGYNVNYTVVNIGSDIVHTLACTGQGNQVCAWPEGAGYNGPPPIFLPQNQDLYDVHGNLLSITGEDLNILIAGFYAQGTLSGTIVIGEGLATFTFNLASDLSFTEVKQL